MSDINHHESQNSNHGDNQGERLVRISLTKAILILVTAVISSAGASIWGTLSVANTVPFRVSALESEVNEIQKEMKAETNLYMPRELSDEKWRTNEISHSMIEKKLGIIEAKIDEIRSAIK